MAKKHTYLSTVRDMPAFPLDAGSGADDPYNGLTKLEYFAASALQALLMTHSVQAAETSAAFAVKAANALIDALNAQVEVVSRNPAALSHDDADDGA